MARGPMACSIAIFIGAVVSAAGSNLDSFTLVVTGRVIMGLGSTVIETCMSKANSLYLSQKLRLFLCEMLLRSGDGPFGFLPSSASQTCVWWARSQPTWTHMPTGQQLMKEARERGDDASMPSSTTRSRFGPRWAILTCVPRFFWLVACTQILQAGVVGDFNGLNADIITETRVSTEQIAGYT
ncbi:hypothetical protein ACHAPD_006875 [Fusarium lateritium]